MLAVPPEMARAHGLRTPMNAIIGLADLLWESPLTTEQREYLRVIRRASHTLLETIDELLLATPDSTRAAESAAPLGDVALPQRPRILMAEDSEDNQLLIQCYLKDAPYELEVVENGTQAVERATTGDYALVLMDIQMPEMDGWSATRAIRQWESEHGTAAIPIIAVSAFARREDHQHSLDCGCNAHITKPLRRGTLLEMLHQHLSTPDRLA